MGGGGSQVTGSHAPSSQVPSSVHCRLNARLKGAKAISKEINKACFQTENLQIFISSFLPFRFIGYMVSWLAFVFAKSANF